MGVLNRTKETGRQWSNWHLLGEFWGKGSFFQNLTCSQTIKSESRMKIFSDIQDLKILTSTHPFSGSYWRIHSHEGSDTVGQESNPGQMAQEARGVLENKNEDYHLCNTLAEKWKQWKGIILNSRKNNRTRNFFTVCYMAHLYTLYSHININDQYWKLGEIKAVLEWECKRARFFS